MRGFFLGRIVRAGLFAILLAPCWPSFAESLVLKDGTVIQGDIRGLQDDVYIVETDSLGTVRVQREQIRTIDHSDERSAGLPATSSPDKSFSEQAEQQALQSRIMQDASLFSMIQALKSDPEVQAILADPEIMSAIASGNYGALMNHPKIIALTGNDMVREVIDEVQ